MASSHHHNQDKDSTLYVGNLDERCTDALVWELMLQCGPVINVHLPKDRVTQNHQGYGFVEFGSEDDAEYAAKIMNQIRVWGKPIRVNKASADRRGGPVGGPGAEGVGLGGGQGVGAELFVGNLDSMVDEKVLYDTFSRFGPLIQAPKVARDDANLSKGYAFISYADFDASDEAINNMHGQYLMNKEITVQYAYKKDGKGERHGDAAERALAAQAKKHGVQVQIPAMPASLVLPVGAPSAPAAMQNGFAAPPTPTAPINGGFTTPRAPQPPPGYNPFGAAAPYAQPPTPQSAYGMPAAPSMNFAPPPAAASPVAAYQNSGAGGPNRAYNQSPLQAPPGAGLPARPPASVGGYGGPPMGVAPGMPGAPPPTFAPPPGFAPPAGPPQGFQPPPGANGFQRR